MAIVTETDKMVAALAQQTGGSPPPVSGPASSKKRAQPAPKPKGPAAPPRIRSEADVKKAIAFPLKTAHDIWANVLHDDYYRLSDSELDSLVDPAYEVVREHEGWIDALIKYSAPISFSLALLSIEADRLTYMLSPEGPETEEAFMERKPPIRTTRAPGTPETVSTRPTETRTEDPRPKPQVVNPDGTPPGTTSPVTNQGRVVNPRVSPT